MTHDHFGFYKEEVTRATPLSFNDSDFEDLLLFLIDDDESRIESLISTQNVPCARQVAPSSHSSSSLSGNNRSRPSTAGSAPYDYRSDLRSSSSSSGQIMASPLPPTAAIRQWSSPHAHSAAVPLDQHASHQSQGVTSRFGFAAVPFEQPAPAQEAAVAVEDVYHAAHPSARAVEEDVHRDPVLPPPPHAAAVHQPDIIQQPQPVAGGAANAAAAAGGGGYDLALITSVSRRKPKADEKYVSVPHSCKLRAVPQDFKLEFREIHNNRHQAPAQPLRYRGIYEHCVELQRFFELRRNRKDVYLSLELETKSGRDWLVRESVLLKAFPGLQTKDRQYAIHVIPRAKLGKRKVEAVQSDGSLPEYEFEPHSQSSSPSSKRSCQQQQQQQRGGGAAFFPPASTALIALIMLLMSNSFAMGAGHVSGITMALMTLSAFALIISLVYVLYLLTIPAQDFDRVENNRGVHAHAVVVSRPRVPQEEEEEEHEESDDEGNQSSDDEVSPEEKNRMNSFGGINTENKLHLQAIGVEYSSNEIDKRPFLTQTSRPSHLHSRQGEVERVKGSVGHYGEANAVVSSHKPAAADMNSSQYHEEREDDLSAVTEPNY